MKESIPSECKPCTAITVDDKVCTFWNDTERVTNLSFEVSLPCSECSECDQIVLWSCNVRHNPFSECSVHVTECSHCQEKACMDCIVFKNSCVRICTDSGFICSRCGDLMIEEVDGRISYKGSLQTSQFYIDCAMTSDPVGR
jgi:hypothetical protein